MSAGRSSQVAACFSVDFTKYLMLSKSMPDRSEPHVGIGFLSNSRRPLSRFLSIHSRLVLAGRDVADDLLGQAAARVGAGSVGVGPAVLVGADALRAAGSWPRCQRWSSLSFLAVGRAEVGSELAGRPCRDVGGADVLTMGKRREPLDMPAEQPGEGLGLGLAQLGERRGDVLHRAVVLAELARRRAALARPRRRSRRRSGPSARACGRLLGAAAATRPRARASSAATGPGESHDGVGHRPRLEEAQRVGGEVVVGLREGVPAGVGQREDLGRPAAAAPAPGRRGAARGPRRPSAGARRGGGGRRRWSGPAGSARRRRWRAVAPGRRATRTRVPATLRREFLLRSPRLAQRFSQRHCANSF